MANLTMEMDATLMTVAMEIGTCKLFSFLYFYSLNVRQRIYTNDLEQASIR